MITRKNARVFSFALFSLFPLSLSLCTSYSSLHLNCTYLFAELCH